MDTSITVRHTNISEEIKSRTHELVAKLASRAHRAQSAQVVFDLQHGRFVVELKLMLARNQVVVATAEESDARTALDRVIDKARNQLEKITPSAARR
jgi:ribosomal subunit interface protein